MNCGAYDTVRTTNKRIMALFEKPFVLSIGPQRAGADMIYTYLKNRGDVCLPADAKEIFFFDRHYLRGVEFYQSNFTPTPMHKIIAEITTTSFDCPDTPARVFDICGGDVTLLCPLRHPISRSYAVYKDYLDYKIVTGDIEHAIDETPQILYASRYADHLERWFNVFGQDKIKILFAEDAMENKEAYFKKLCDSVGLTFNPAMMNDVKINPPEKDADQETLKCLQHRLRGEISKLENLLGKTITAWK